MEREATHSEARDGQVNTEPELEEFYRNEGRYGSQNPAAPGEPERDSLPTSDPVPNTGYDTKQEHKREHEQENETPQRRTNP